MKTYTIKPLQWVKDGSSPIAEFAEVPGGTYRVTAFQDRVFHWSYWFSEADEDLTPCNSAEEGKAAAEKHWLERLAPSLEEVPHSATIQPQTRPDGT